MSATVHGHLKRTAPLSRKARYRRDERLWAWLFLGGTWIAIPTFIVVSARAEGAPLEDALLSVAGFLAVSAALFVWARRRTGAAWTAVVETKRLVVRRDKNGQESVYPRIHARTSRGRRVRAEVTADGFAFLREGDMIMKEAGFNFPVKIGGAGERRICPACGSVYAATDAACRGCGFENV